MLVDGIIAQPDGSIWDLPLLSKADKAILASAQGVSAHLIPNGANARTAKPKVLSPKGILLPVGVPGELAEAP